MGNIGVVKHSKTHRDLFVYYYADDIWLRFMCQLNTPGMDRCTGPSFVSRPDYQRAAHGDEEARALQKLAEAQARDY